jgi:hypothetical protein
MLAIAVSVARRRRADWRAETVGLERFEAIRSMVMKSSSSYLVPESCFNFSVAALRNSASLDCLVHAGCPTTHRAGDNFAYDGFTSYKRTAQKCVSPTAQDIHHRTAQSFLSGDPCRRKTHLFVRSAITPFGGSASARHPKRSSVNNPISTKVRPGQLT